jgi:DinB superfamily
MDPHLEKLQVELLSALAGVSPERLNWHPPGKWSTNEVIEHLYLTYTATTKGFSRVVEAGKPKVTSSTWRQRAASLLVLGIGHLPSGRTAPPMAVPRGLPAEKVRGEIAAKIAEMDAMLSACETKFGARTKVLDHVILGPLTIAQWRKFHLVHGRHHIRQLHGLRKAAENS